MQAISHATGAFAPIRSSKTQSHTAKAAVEPISTQHLQNKPEKTSGIWEKNSFSVWDIIDAINPLQHIPIISTIYRKITGDEMGYASRIAGDTLYGGALGNMVSSLISAVANVFVDSTTGKDIGEHMIATVTPTKATKQPPVQTPMQFPIQPTTTPPPHHPVAASLSKQHTGIVPSQAPSKIQAGIDHYKWQALTSEVKNLSNYWV